MEAHAQGRDALPAEIDRPAQQPVHLPVPGDAVDRAVGAAREPAPLLDRLIRRGVADDEGEHAVYRPVLLNHEETLRTDVLTQELLRGKVLPPLAGVPGALHESAGVVIDFQNPREVAWLRRPDHRSSLLTSTPDAAQAARRA